MQHYVISKDGSQVLSFKSAKVAQTFQAAEMTDGFVASDDTKSMGEVPVDVMLTLYNRIRPEKPLKKFADRETAQTKMKGVLEVLATPGVAPAVVGAIGENGKATATPKAERKPRDPNTPALGRGSKNGDWTIERIMKENPRKAGTSGHRSRELITDGMTVDAFLKAGGIKRDLEWDIDKGWTRLVAPTGVAVPTGTQGTKANVPESTGDAAADTFKAEIAKGASLAEAAAAEADVVEAEEAKATGTDGKAKAKKVSAKDRANGRGKKR